MLFVFHLIKPQPIFHLSRFAKGELRKGKDSANNEIILNI